METTIAKPYALDKDEGKAVSAFGALTTLKAEDSQTGDTFGLSDELMPPGFERPGPGAALLAQSDRHDLTGNAGATGGAAGR